MSRANPDVDLGSLARPESTSKARSRRRAWTIAVPVAILLGFGAVLVSSLDDLLTRAIEVEIVRPTPLLGRAAGGAAPAGKVVVQAAGWIEPDPFPTRVAALTPGVVEELLVQESDVVEAGDPVARLVDEDARLALRSAQASKAEAVAERSAREAELAAARESFDAALAVTERVASARSDLAGKRAEARHREQASIEARARLSAAESEVVVQRHLEDNGAAGPRQVELAQAELARVAAEVEIVAADAELARADATSAEAVLARAEGDLALRTEEKLRLASAEAALELARARVERRAVGCEEAALRLERTTVRAPAAGIVLERLVAPGAEVGARDAALVTLYDPRSVRVRVDVPQGDVAQLFVGQRVRIESEARRGEPYAGELMRIVRQADINKVTLQAHVRVLDPDELLRPEMLVQARFLGGGADGPGAGAETPAGVTSGAQAVRIPVDVVLDGRRVWVLDALGREVRSRDVTLGERSDADVVVLEGLNLSDKVVATRLAELEPGTRVAVIGERRRP